MRAFGEGIWGEVADRVVETLVCVAGIVYVVVQSRASWQKLVNGRSEALTVSVWAIAALVVWHAFRSAHSVAREVASEHPNSYSYPHRKLYGIASALTVLAVVASYFSWVRGPTPSSTKETVGTTDAVNVEVHRGTKDNAAVTVEATGVSPEDPFPNLNDQQLLEWGKKITDQISRLANGYSQRLNVAMTIDDLKQRGIEGSNAQTYAAMSYKGCCAESFIKYRKALALRVGALGRPDLIKWSEQLLSAQDGSIDQQLAYGSGGMIVMVDQDLKELTRAMQAKIQKESRPVVTPTPGVPPISTGKATSAPPTDKPASDGGSTPATINNAPGGFAISGGIVTNPTVNNYGPLPATLRWSQEPQEQGVDGDNKVSSVMVNLSADRSVEVPAFIAVCDRPCETLRAMAAGLSQIAPLTFPNQPTVTGINMLQPRPWGAGIPVYWQIRGLDSEPIHILRIEMIRQ
jgi:hypothetical protein